MKTRPKIYVVIALFLCFAALVWAQTEYKWSEKLASLTVGSMNGDAMFMVLVDPNGTPASGLIGQTEALANWVGSTAVTTLGTIATGTWQATDVGVEYGGTGVSTLTDGGILLGSGTGAITALGVAANGQIPIGDGTTDPVLATITGTANEVTVTNAAGTITLSLPNDAGTDISADLEEETHATEHQDTGGDEIAVTAGMMNAGTGASATTFWRGDNTWGTPAGAGDMTKAVYDVSNDGHVDGNDVVYAAAWNGDVNAPSMNAVYDKIEGLSSTYQPLEATLTDIADGTIAEDLVNTANPWADNEVSDTLTIGAASTVANGALDADLQTLAASTAWRVFYSNGTSVLTELALGADNTYLRANGVSAAPTWDTPTGSGDMTKAVYDVLDDGFVDGNDTAYAASWNANINAPSMNAVYDKIEGLSSVYQPLEATLTDIADGTITENLVNTANPWAANEITEADPLALLTAGTDNVKDTHIDWGSGAGQVDLADIPGGTAGASAFDFTSATSLAVPNAESADATLTALGQLHIRGDEDRISAHLGAGGEIAGEATMSWLKRTSVTLDPGSWYNSSAYVNLGPILAKQYPNGIIIDYWEVTCHLNPDVEMDLDLCYSMNSFDFADPNIVDVMDTAAGVSSEDDDANINAGAAVPAGVYLYLRFGTDPEGTATMMTATVLYHGKED